jgi:hypothetical protein
MLSPPGRYGACEERNGVQCSQLAQLLSYNGAGGWAPAVDTGISIASDYPFLGAVPMAITRIPCQAGWAVGYVGGSTSLLRFFSFAGAALGNQDAALSGLAALTNAVELDASCASGTSHFAVAGYTS